MNNAYHTLPREYHEDWKSFQNVPQYDDNKGAQ